MSITRQVDDKLIDSIYGIVFGEERWDRFLTELNGLLPGGGTSLFYHDAARAEGSSQFHINMDQAWIDTYSRYYCRLNPWISGLNATPTGQGAIGEDFISYAELSRTEFFNDFWHRHEGHGAVGMAILREGSRSFNLSITTTRWTDPDESRACAALLTRIGPHLKRAFVAVESGGRQKSPSEIDGRLFDAIGVGVLLLNSERRLVSATALGEAVLEQGRGLWLSPLGILHLADRDADDRLTLMLRHGEEAERQQTVMADGRKITLLKLEKSRQPRFFERPVVAILIEPKQTATGLSDEKLRRDFGLTPAEIRVVRALISGGSVAGLAAETGRSRETIRSQVRSVYMKTGTRKQVELLRLIQLGERPAGTPGE
jgi:DNA-binding CsgD family transcriptional regulator